MNNARGRLRFSLVSALLAVIIVLSACTPHRQGAIKMMRELGHGEVALAPHNGKAIVIFVRPKDPIYTHQTALFEVEGQAVDPRLIALLAANTSIIYETRPGKHLFMSSGFGAQADFITADLLSDSTYFVLVDGSLSSFGPYRFFLKPPGTVGLSSSDMKARFDESRVVTKSSESEQWAHDNMPSIRSKLDTYNKKSASGEVPHLDSSNDSKAVHK